MSQLLSIITLLPALWLIIVPWTGWYGPYPMPQCFDSGLGLIVIILSLVQIFRSGSRPRFKAIDGILMLLGLILIVAGIGFTGQFAAVIRAGEIITGLLILLLAWVAWHLPNPSSAKMFSADGSPLMEINELIADRKGVGVKGKLMGTMPATIYLRPEELWKLLVLVPLRIIWAILRMILLPSSGNKNKTG